MSCLPEDLASPDLIYRLTIVTGWYVSNFIPLNSSHRNRVQTNIFVAELVSKAHALGLMFDRFAVNNGVLELLHDRLVDRVTLPFC
jgi:hypothetical protein